MQLQQFGHDRGLFSGLARAFLEAFDQRLQLLLWRCRSDQAIAQPPGGLRRFRARGGYVNGTGCFWSRIQARAFHPEVFAGIAHLLARKQLLDDLDGLHHAFQALRRVGPFAAHDMLVERFARADAQPETAGVHDGQGCC